MAVSPTAHPIVDLASVVFDTTDVAASAAFYGGPFGLICTERGTDRAALRGAGPHPVLLELRAAEHAGLRGFTVLAAARREVDDLAERLAGHGLAVESGPGPRGGPLGGYGLAVRDPAGLLVEVRADVRRAAALGERAAPVRVAHVGVNCADVEAEVAFYVDTLGLAVTDEYEGRQTVFLAIGRDHHRLVVNAAERDGGQHVAFELADLDAVMIGLGRMRAAGHDTIWGPGRHGPGGNAFCYYEDPAGLVVEHSTAPFQLAPGGSWQPQVWQRTPANADVWGLGGPSPRAVTLMSGRR